MKIVLSFLVSFFVFSIALHAQQNHFVFIQSDTRQPFNITINKKVYSSTASGYVIVPKVLSGKYAVSVGFGGNAIPDQNFNIEVLQKDVGYTLKNVDQKGWALFNLQNFETTYAGNTNEQSPDVGANNSNVAKSSNVPERTFQPEVNSPSTNDTRKQLDTISAVSVKPNPVTNAVTPANEKVDQANSETQSLQKEKEPSIEVVTAKEKKIDGPLPVTKNETAANNPIIKNLPVKSRITKISELKGGEAIYITFVDESYNQSDTINVLIPDNKSQVSKEDKPADKSDLKFLEINSSPSKEVTQPSSAIKSEDKIKEAGSTKSSGVFSKCNASATNDDFLKLRRKMAAAIDNDGMISEAKKIFKVMCFSTEQVKNLAYLFLTDQARYQFFDASYPSVSDSANFSSLSIMLSDVYYINRFKAMLID